jgi:hypothetical protein
VFFQRIILFVVGTRGPADMKNVNKIAQKEQVCHLKKRANAQAILSITGKLDA